MLIGHRKAWFLMAAAGVAAVALCLAALPALAQQAGGRAAQVSAAPAAPPPPEAQAAGQVRTPQTIYEYFIAGGVVMWPILGCSVAALAFVLERLLSLRRGRVVDDGGFHRTLDLARTKGAGAALAHVKQSPSPMNRVLAAVLTCSSSPRAEMEAMIENAGARELWDLQRRTRPLGVISNIAPLLGLLGTVTGIIRAFTQLAAKQTAIGNPAELASGIYEALITTAAGLIVAIPVYLLYHFLGDKADSLIRDIEEKALELVAVVFERRGPEAGSAPADLAEAHPPYGGRPQGGPEAGHEGA